MFAFVWIIILLIYPKSHCMFRHLVSKLGIHPSRVYVHGKRAEKLFHAFSMLHLKSFHGKNFRKLRVKKVRQSSISTSNENRKICVHRSFLPEYVNTCLCSLSSCVHAVCLHTASFESQQRYVFSSWETVDRISRVLCCFRIFKHIQSVRCFQRQHSKNNEHSLFKD